MALSPLSRNLEARADKSASGLMRKLRVDPRRHPLIVWRWRIDQAIPEADKRIASREDSPARLLIAFDGDRSKLDVEDRAMMNLADALSGQQMPYATLMYVYSHRYPPGTVLQNPRTTRIQMIVVEQGSIGLDTDPPDGPPADLDRIGDDRNLQVLPAALHLQRHVLSALRRDGGNQVVPVVHRGAVHADDLVADAQAATRPRRTFLHAAHDHRQQAPQPDFDETVMNNRERRHFFGDEEDTFPFARGSSDDVRDGLRLAGPWWALNN
jgi:hypothetical protein